MARRSEMSGFFDWLKGQKSLFDVFSKPAKSGEMIPAPEQKLSPVEFFRPKPQLPARIEPQKQELAPSEVLRPRLPARPQESKKPVEWGSLIPKPPPAEMKPVGEVARTVFRSQEPAVPRYKFIPPPEIEPGRTRELILYPGKKLDWRLPTPEELAEHFRRTFHNLDAMWDYIRQIRANTDWKKDQLIASWQGSPIALPLDPVVYKEEYTDFSNFYGIPWSVMEAILNVPPEQEKQAREKLFTDVISPLNAMVPEAFEILKPQDIPGFFNVSFIDPSGQYYLFYIEPLLGTGG